MPKGYTDLMDPSADAVIAAALDPIALTAGGTGDNTKAVSTAIDKAASTPFNAMMLNVQARAVLAQDKTLVATVAVEHTDADNFDTPGDVETEAVGTLTLTGGNGGSTETGELNANVNVLALKRRFRVAITPNLNATNTDTAVVMATACYRGLAQSPMIRA